MSMRSSCLCTYLESEDGVDGEVGKVVLVLRQNLGGESSTGNVDKILTERGRVGSASIRLMMMVMIEKSVSSSSTSRR